MPLETVEAVALYLKQNLNVTSKVQGIQLIQLLQMLGRIARDPKGEYIGVAGLPIANLPTPTLAASLTSPRPMPDGLTMNRAR